MCISLSCTFWVVKGQGHPSRSKVIFFCFIFVYIVFVFSCVSHRPAHFEWWKGQGQWWPSRSKVKKTKSKHPQPSVGTRYAVLLLLLWRLLWHTQCFTSLNDHHNARSQRSKPVKFNSTTQWCVTYVTNKVQFWLVLRIALGVCYVTRNSVQLVGKIYFKVRGFLAHFYSRIMAMFPMAKSILFSQNLVKNSQFPKKFFFFFF